MMPCDVLILTAQFGQGHVSVSNAILGMFQEKAADLNILCVDPFESFCDEYRLYKNLYRRLSLFFPRTYDLIYRYKEHFPNNIFDAFLYHKHWRDMAQILETHRPKLVISTFPICSGLVSRVKRYENKNFPLITVMTDVVDSWEWIHEETDFYCVPTPAIQQSLLQKGIAKEKISVTGIPVKKEFLTDDKIQGDARWEVLIIANALTHFKINEKHLRALEALPHYHFTLVTGTQKKLYEKLQEKQFSNITVLGYVNHMPALMKQSDFIVTKPGGITIHEAIQSQIPMLISSKAIGQEKANAQFITNANLGITLSNLEDLKHILLALEEDYLPYRAWKESLAQVKKYQRPYQIIDFVSHTLCKSL